MDKDLAFEKINEIFYAISTQDKLPSWKLEELRKVLKTLQEDTYKRGRNKGVNECIELLNSAK